MSDSTGAAGIVRNKFDTAQNYASDAWYTALTFLERLGGVAKLTYPSVDLPELPQTPEYPGVPDAPGLAAIAVEDVAAPEAPEFFMSRLDGFSVPDFAVVPPEVILPEEPDLAWPEAPSGAPALAEIETPADPAVVLPDPPVFDPVAIPELPGPITPTFEGERPPMPELLAPGNLFVMPREAAYDSSLRRTLAARLEGEVRTGGAGYGPELEARLWERAKTVWKTNWRPGSPSLPTASPPGARPPCPAPWPTPCARPTPRTPTRSPPATWTFWPGRRTWPRNRGGQR